MGFGPLVIMVVLAFGCNGLWVNSRLTMMLFGIRILRIWGGIKTILRVFVLRAGKKKEGIKRIWNKYRRNIQDLVFFFFLARFCLHVFYKLGKVGF
uniref:Transmembrane protein n=1 Tax=Rhizophora mucronata TaxID=61149 RepID=A0A2P2J005_RHIMU